MRPLTCPGGYSVPIRAGRMEIVGVRATVSNTALVSQVVLYDDGGITDSRFGRILPSTYEPGSSTDKKCFTICNIKGIANLDAGLEVLFPETFKTSHGVSVAALTNIVPGSLQVYCR